MSNEETPLLQDPHNAAYERFSPSQKKVLVLIVSIGALVAFITSGMFIPTIPRIVEDLNSTEEVVSYAVGVYMFTSTIGSLVASRYSSFYGRRPIYLWWFPVLIIGSIGVASAHNVSEIMVWRFVQAIGACPGLSVAPGVIGDIFKLEERGMAFGIYFSIGLLGSAVAPTIGGIVTYYWSWRAVHGLNAILAFGAFIFVLFFLPETMHQGSKGFDVYRQGGRTSHSKWLPMMLNPVSQLTVLRSPNILAISFIKYAGLLTDFVLSEALLVPLPYTIGKRYGIKNEALLGLCFLPLGVGKAVGAPLSGWISDKIVIKYKSKRGVWYPEDRLRACLFSCYLPFTVLGSALITKYVSGIPGLVLNLLCLFLNGIGCDLALTPCVTYVVDVLHSKSAEANAAINTVRSIAVAVSTAMLLPAINAYGYFFTNLVVATLATLGTGLTMVTITYGDSMRCWADIDFSTVDNN